MKDEFYVELNQNTLIYNIYIRDELVAYTTKKEWANLITEKLNEGF